MKTDDIKKNIEDLKVSKYFELISEIEVFNVFDFEPQKFLELAIKCSEFSMYAFQGECHAVNRYFTANPHYPLANLQKKTIKLLKLKRDMPVYEIKILAEVSFNNFTKLEKSISSVLTLDYVNCIFTGKRHNYDSPGEYSYYLFADQRSNINPHLQREMTRLFDHHKMIFPIFLISQRPSREIIKEGAHIIWL
jgi:hypothetical protein